MGKAKESRSQRGSEVLRADDTAMVSSPSHIRLLEGFRSSSQDEGRRG